MLNPFSVGRQPANEKNEETTKSKVNGEFELEFAIQLFAAYLLFKFNFNFEFKFNIEYVK